MNQKGERDTLSFLVSCLAGSLPWDLGPGTGSVVAAGPSLPPIPLS